MNAGAFEEGAESRGWASEYCPRLLVVLKVSILQATVAIASWGYGPTTETQKPDTAVKGPIGAFSRGSKWQGKIEVSRGTKLRPEASCLEEVDVCAFVIE